MPLSACLALVVAAIFGFELLLAALLLPPIANGVVLAAMKRLLTVVRAEPLPRHLKYEFFRTLVALRFRHSRYLSMQIELDYFCSARHTLIA
jgi:hypothetical protein